MKIFFSPFKTSNVKENSRKGVLLKVEFSQSKIGHTCFVSDRNWNDPSLKICLENLKKGIPHSALLRSLEWAKKESECLGESLFTEKRVRSHYFLKSLDHFDESLENKLLKRGFKTLKMKVGEGLNLDFEKMKSCIQHSTLSWRLDFNNFFSYKDFLKWCDKHSDWLEKVEFFEDPFPYKKKEWSFIKERFPIRLALDQFPNHSDALEGFDVLVIKPVRDNLDKIIKIYKDKNVDFVITHFMDHSLGQLIALKGAQELQKNLNDRLKDCGLLRSFDTEGFSLLEEGSFLIPPQGSGWGIDFDDVSWRAL